MTTSKQYLMKLHLMAGNVIVLTVNEWKKKTLLMYSVDIMEKLVLMIEYMGFVITRFNSDSRRKNYEIDLVDKNHRIFDGGWNDRFRRNR